MKAFCFLLVVYPLMLWAQTPSLFSTYRLLPLKNSIARQLNGVDTEIIRVNYIGNPKAIGGFEGAGSLFQMSSGIVLSTGKVSDLCSKTKKDPTTGVFNHKPHPFLKPYQSGPISDAAILEIDFIPHSNFISFNLVMASTAYPEFVEAAYDDLTLALLYDPDGRISNIATLKNSTEAISIRLVNHQKNPEYFIRNSSKIPFPSPDKVDTLNIKNGRQTYKIIRKKNTELANQTLFNDFFLCDGMTKVMQCVHAVDSGKKHRLRIVVADQGNALFDTAIFIEAGSFRSSPDRNHSFGVLAQNPQYYEKIDTLKSNYNNSFNLNNKHSAAPTLCHSSFPQIQFEFDSDTLSLLARQQLDSIAKQMGYCMNSKIQIDAYAAALFDEKYNQNLSKARAKKVQHYLLNKGVLAYRIRIRWHGNAAKNDLRLLQKMRYVQLKISSF